jgi:hypothetical protein
MPQETTVKVMLIVRHEGASKWEGMGSREYAVLPRIGESVELDVDGIGCSYRVVMVRHPETPTSNAADLYAVYENVTSYHNTLLLDA